MSQILGLSLLYRTLTQLARLRAFINRGQGIMSEKRKTITIVDPRKMIFAASGGTLLFLGIMIIFVAKWGQVVLDWEFVTDKAYAADKVLMTEAVEAHETAIEARMLQMEIEQAKQSGLIEDNITATKALSQTILLTDAVNGHKAAEQAYYLHQLDETRNGITHASSIRREELRLERDSAKEYRDCVIDERRNCDSLRTH